ncbi:homoserine dehydrogenase [Salsuginibacillus kocurii]|uniref:homoserine dehydrogenase n=1 Tax=Salsuginibacillus kocurii TaxID=427078 RepID=UPI000372AC38|nr:homoserine dehydrogenase [Salsuginibacillus kocurii]
MGQNEVKVGLLGLGTVGTGVVQLLNEHVQKIEHQVGGAVRVTKALVADKTKDRGDIDLNDLELTESAAEVINDTEIDVVIELIGGVEEARQLISDALANKKQVVTANKDLIAMYGAELLEKAAENSCDLFYEASVAGGIPIIRSLTEGLSADQITKMMGIVNGTTNYILTKMNDEGRSYDDVLQEAKDLGFAESDPTADVEGLDAARKMAILATLGFSMNVDLEDVDVRGITTISAEDMDYSEQLGYTIKLIGLAERDTETGKVDVSVQPALLPADHQLAAVKNEYNAVYVYGEAVGETMFYGPGAGSLPTATAVVSDLITVVKNNNLGVSGRSMVPPQFEKSLKSDEDIRSKYFLRMHVKDETGVFDEITSLFSKHDISFEKILQVPLAKNGAGKAEVVMITHETSRTSYEVIYEKLKSMESIHELESSYRVEGGTSE